MVHVVAMGRKARGVAAMALLLALSVGAGLAAPAAREWVGFERLQEPPVRFETRIPAQATLVEGPAGRRAVAVSVPDLHRDEKACAFALDVPTPGEGFNGVKLWLKGSRETTRLEVVFRTPAGAYVADVPVGPEWREVSLGADDMGPHLGTRGGRLDVAAITGVRFCFGEWQGLTAGPHHVSVGPMTLVHSPWFAAPGTVRSTARPVVPRPLQPFTVELLDLNRGSWEFQDALGQNLALDGPVTAYAFGAPAGSGLRLAYLRCDPEYPDDLAHATLAVTEPAEREGQTTWFRIREPYFACTAAVRPLGGGVLRCDLHRIRLGPAVTGDRYVAALYLMAGQRALPLWLAGSPAGRGPHVRLLTDRVGGVFDGAEPIRVSLVGLCPGEGWQGAVSVRATDYATGQAVWRRRVRVAFAKGAATLQVLAVPLRRLGVFEVTASARGTRVATARVCRIPKRRPIDPDASAIGMNLFQQQIWWYAYQAPLMAQAGVRWIRPWLAWENTWPTQQPKEGTWDTRALDAALRRMAMLGQRYQLILFGAPGWATGGASWSGPPPGKMGLWGRYVEALVRRYRGRIRHYEVWNEPDLMWSEETRHSGEHYLRMLETTWAAARRADPRCVLLGLSHAGYEEWLENVGKLGGGRYMDAATIHTYAGPADFASAVERRREILARHGMGRKPLWVNEIGATAYDFSPAYSARYQCSERKQAATLVANYAQALAADPRGKVFWFCTHDPRDPAHESQWTWDAGIGVLYLGFLPKLSYAALAGVAAQLDGRPCLGQAQPARGLHQVSFGSPGGRPQRAAPTAVMPMASGPLAVVWHDASVSSLPATRLGCLPQEQIAVRDMMGNRVASGRAGRVRLDLSRGPVYLVGSRQLGGIARAERAVSVRPKEVALPPGGSAQVDVVLPSKAVMVVSLPSGAPLSVVPRPGPGDRRLVLTCRPGIARASAVLRVRVRPALRGWGLAAPVEVVRTISVTVGEPNLIRDGGFAGRGAPDWSPERSSRYEWDGAVGHAAPGSLRLDGPVDRRLVHWNIEPKAGRPVRLTAWVRTERLSGCQVTLNLACFGPKGWLQTWCLATTGGHGDIEGGWRTLDTPGHIPLGTTGWTQVEALLPAELLPAGATRAAFFLDANGGGEGRLWIDDVDLWQPERDDR